MGCDIHIYSERWHEGQERWVPFDFYEYNEYRDEMLKWANNCDEEHQWHEPEFTNVEIGGARDYYRFGVLSTGVRGEMPFSFEPRGIPDDCSNNIKKHYEAYGCDAHSANWITLREFNDMYVKYRIAGKGENPLAEMKREIDDHIKRKLKWPHLIEKQDPNHIRFIYWFDN